MRKKIEEIIQHDLMFKKVYQKCKEFSADEKPRDLYEAREQFELDRRTRLNEATRIGLKQGFEQGLKQGLERGLEQSV